MMKILSYLISCPTFESEFPTIPVICLKPFFFFFFFFFFFRSFTLVYVADFVADGGEYPMCLMNYLLENL
jgi:hypothetical protein